MVRPTYIAAHTTSACNRNSSCTKCDRRCGMIIGATIGSIIGFVMFVILICKVYGWVKRRRRHVFIESTHNENAKQLEEDIQHIEALIGSFLDMNPSVLDMCDYKLPKYLMEQFPDNMNEKDAQIAMYVIARRRIALVQG